MGFFFAGIKPGSGNGDVIILQYQNNHGIDYEYVAIGCDESRQILEYVREHDPNYQNNNKFQYYCIKYIDQVPYNMSFITTNKTIRYRISNTKTKNHEKL